jgi:CubicO group peptidase (beta-lactamase class C family)
MSEFLNDFRIKIEANHLNVFSISEQVNGEEPQTLFLKPTNPSQNCYSISKVYVVTAIGLLQDRGKLSVNDYILPYFADDLPENLPTDKRWKHVTIDMLLRHYSGMPANFLDVDLFGFQTFGKHFTEYIFSHPLQHDPAEKSVYTDAAFYLLAFIAEKVAKKPLDDFLWKQLFYPLHHSETAWSHCPDGHVLGGTGLFVRTEDMVKLGTLYMQGGMYEGTRILSENWVNTVLKRGYELKEISPNIYAKGGMFNQMLLFMPQTHRAVAWNAYDESSFAPLMQYLATQA